MKKNYILATIFAMLLLGTKTMAQELIVLDENTLYHIKIGDLYLTDTAIDFDEEYGQPINEVYTGNAVPTLQDLKADSWSQLWSFTDHSDSYSINNYYTERYVWTNARTPQIGETWAAAAALGDNGWAEMPPIDENLKLRMGPSGESVGLGGWNRFKINEDDAGKINFSPVWNHEDFWKGGFLPEDEVAGSEVIVFRPSEMYDWEIVEVCSFDEVPDDSGIAGLNSIRKILNDKLKYTIDGQTVSANELFEVFTVIGNSLGSHSSVTLESGIYFLRSTAGNTAKILIK